MKYDPIMCMNVPDSFKTKDANKNEGFKIHKAEIRGDKLYLTYTDLLYGGKETESFTKSEAKGFLTDPWNTWEGNTKSVMMKFVKDSDKKIGVHDADPIAALSNFKKTAEYGDSIKIDIGKGKTAIVQKEANGWYATIGNEKVKGTFNIIAGYLKSASAKDSVSVMMKFVKDSKTIDKAIRNCDRDPYEYETIKNDIDIAARGKASYITKSSLQSRITRGFQTNRLTKEQKEELWRLAESVKQ